MAEFNIVNGVVTCGSYHTRERTKYTYSPTTGHCTGSYGETYGVCWGTRECDECKCGGDASKCDFYDYIRKEAKGLLEHEKLVKKEKRNNNQKKFVPQEEDMRKIDPTDALAMQDLSTFSIVENSLDSLGKEGKIFVIDKAKKLSYVMLLADGKAEWYKTGTQEDWEKYRGKQR